jgi:hypothetical protein
MSVKTQDLVQFLCTEGGRILNVAWLDQLLFGFSHQVVGESSWVICFAQRFRPSVSMSLRDIRSIRQFPR